jgi:hypothetical protein
MNQYALRCIEDNYPKLLQLATILGVIEMVDGNVVEKNGGIWDFVGYKYVGESPLEGGEDTRTILTNNKGKRFVHINVRTPVNVREVAEALALSNPEIAGALSKVPDYFITDAEGNATLPEFPLRVFL